VECERTESLLSLFLDAELPRNEEFAVRKHLASCPRCSRLFTLMKDARESLSELPELEVRQELLEELYTLPSRRKRRRWISALDILVRPSLQPVFAVGTVLLIITSFYLFHPNRPQINRTLEKQLHIGYSRVERLLAKADSLAHSLGEFKDEVLVSFHSLKPGPGNEAEEPKSLDGGPTWKKKSS